MKIEDFKSFYKHDDYTKLLNYKQINSSTIFHENGDMTAIVKAYITKIDEVDKIREINERIFNYFDILAPDTEVVFYLNRVVDKTLYKVRGGVNKEIVHYLNKKRENFFNSSKNMICLNPIAITLKANNDQQKEKKSFIDSFKNIGKSIEFKLTHE